MKISKQAQREAKALFRACIIKGAPDDQRVRQLVQLLIQRKPRGYLAILEFLTKLIELDLQRRAAHVESPAPLSADLQEKVRANLAQRYGSGLNITFAQNPTLIGGLRIRVGSDVYDGSVRGRLIQLQDAF
jgi:F-type H+-transporting ATPase subunit delta